MRHHLQRLNSLLPTPTQQSISITHRDSQLIPIELKLLPSDRPRMHPLPQPPQNLFCLLYYLLRQFRQIHPIHHTPLRPRLSNFPPPFHLPPPLRLPLSTPMTILTKPPTPTVKPSPILPTPSHLLLPFFSLFLPFCPPLSVFRPLKAPFLRLFDHLS